MGKPVWWLGLLAGLVAGGVRAEDMNVQLEEIVVTPYAGMAGVPSASIPYTMRTYPAGEIEKSKTSSLVEFLNRDSAVAVADYYGTGVKTSVDLMGFGDTASSNLLLMVDGRRVNDIDLSGIDWTQVSLGTVERVEIIKGAGSVLYGDNAAGGVINVITRRPRPEKMRAKMRFRAGSYALDEETVEAEGGDERLAVSLHGVNSSTDGYRDNSFYRSQELALNLDFRPRETTGLRLDSGHHRYRYGLPGALYAADLDSGLYSRRGTRYPDDRAENEDNYVDLRLRQELTDRSRLEMGLNVRNKTGLDSWLSYGGWNFSTDRHIASVGLRPQFLVSAEIFGRNHDIVAGGEWEQCDFSADKDDYSVFDADDATDIDRRSRGWFLQDNLRLTERLSLLLGVRDQREDFTFDYASAFSTIDDELKFREGAYEAGLNCRTGGNGNAYLCFSRGFRTPKTDEYFSVFGTPPVNKELLPQTSRTVSAGFNRRLTKRFRAGAGIFFMRTEDEIYYDSLNYANANYDRTKRRGADVSLDWRICRNLTLDAGGAFTDAEFEKGAHGGKRVPGVAQSKFNAGLNWQARPDLTFILENSCRGQEYLINDLDNVLPRLDDYWLTGARAIFRKSAAEFFVGVNNIFNREYLEYAATNAAASVRAYYPSPERNFFGGMNVEF